MRRSSFQFSFCSSLSLPVRAIGIALVGLAWVGCARGKLNARAGIDPKPSVLAPKSVENSLSLTSSNKIVINKTSLGKEFLLMGEMVAQQPAPQFSALKSRIVSFKLVGDSLYMMDVTNGGQAGGLKRDLVLTSFPAKVTSSAITFDFNQGMSQVFVQGDWFSSDSETYQPLSDVGNLVTSFISSAKFDTKQNLLSITQTAEMSDNGISDVKIRYYLQPYHPNPSFEPVLAPPNMKQFGYFEVAPRPYPDGSRFIRAAKFDIQKPITYAISANTPKQYRKAIRDGILYWNKSFGRPVMKVIQLTDPSIQAPNPDYNIIQWVNDDTQAYAYADAQMDPRSGQVLHAQVYLPSVFADVSRVGAESLQRELNPKGKQLAIKGMSPVSLCHYPEAKALDLKDAGLIGVPQNIILRAVQDDLTQTVAHEVGHTLGLRHNFAGSLADNSKLQNFLPLFKQFLQTGDVSPSWMGSSSVMDYMFFEEDVMLGQRIADGDSALSYDKEAIQHLYYGKQFTGSKVLPFCTDSDLGHYADCRQFDVGSSSVQFDIWHYRHDLNRAAENLIETYIADKVPFTQGQPQLPVDQVILHPLTNALSDSKDRFRLINDLTSKSHFVKVESTVPFVSSLNSDDVQSQEQAALHQDLQQFGGLPAALAEPTHFAQRSYARFVQLLNTTYSSGVSDGKQFSFSESDKRVMEQNAKEYFAKLQDDLVILDLRALSGLPIPTRYDEFLSDTGGDVSTEVSDIASIIFKIPWAPIVSNDLAQQLLNVISARIQKYTFSMTGQVVTVTAKDIKGKPVTVNLPVFKYPYRVRVAAAMALLRTDRTEDPAWGLARQSLFQEEMVGQLFKSGATSVGLLDPSSVNPVITKWVQENKMIFQILGGSASLWKTLLSGQLKVAKGGAPAPTNAKHGAVGHL